MYLCRFESCELIGEVDSIDDRQTDRQTDLYLCRFGSGELIWEVDSIDDSFVLLEDGHQLGVQHSRRYLSDLRKMRLLFLSEMWIRIGLIFQTSRGFKRVYKISSPPPWGRSSSSMLGKNIKLWRGEGNIMAMGKNEIYTEQVTFYKVPEQHGHV